MPENADVDLISDPDAIVFVAFALREILGLNKQEEAKIVSTLTETLEKSRTL